MNVKEDKSNSQNGQIKKIINGKNPSLPEEKTTVTTQNN
jgi:hypothetical protein